LRYRDGIDFARKAIVESSNIDPAWWPSVLHDCSMDWISGRDSGRQRNLGHTSLGWIAEQMPIQHEAERSAIWKNSAAPVWD